MIAGQMPAFVGQKWRVWFVGARTLRLEGWISCAYEVSCFQSPRRYVYLGYDVYDGHMNNVVDGQSFYPL